MATMSILLHILLCFYLGGIGGENVPPARDSRLRFVPASAESKLNTYIPTGSNGIHARDVNNSTTTPKINLSYIKSIFKRITSIDSSSAPKPRKLSLGTKTEIKTNITQPNNNTSDRTPDNDADDDRSIWQKIKDWFDQAGLDIKGWFVGVGSDISNWFKETGPKIGEVALCAVIGLACALGLVLVAIPLTIYLLGFGCGGVMAGSFAAGIQTSHTVAGSWFAILQSAGAAGLNPYVGIPMIVVTTAVATTITYFARNVW